MDYETPPTASCLFGCLLQQCQEVLVKDEDKGRSLNQRMYALGLQWWHCDGSRWTRVLATEDREWTNQKRSALSPNRKPASKSPSASCDTSSLAMPKWGTWRHHTSKSCSLAQIPDALFSSIFPFVTQCSQPLWTTKPKVRKAGKEMRKSDYRLDLCSKSFLHVSWNLSFLAKKHLWFPGFDTGTTAKLISNFLRVI